LKFWHSNNYFN